MKFERRTFCVFNVAIVVGLFLSSMAARPQSTSPEPLSAFPQSLLAVRTAAGKVINFKIWIADTPRREEQGMMFVHEMDEHTGMLFMFPENRLVSMWMKNTYIPLDLLFLDAKGKIDFIAASATPQSETIIGPPTPEYAVLELKGGTCVHFDIKRGDVVLYKNFHNAR